MKQNDKIINISYSNIFSDVLISSLLLTVFIIIFEITFYFVIINPALENTVISFIDNTNPYYINLTKEFPELSQAQQNIIKNEISNTIRQTINKIESNIKSKRKKLLAILFGLLSVFIIFVITISILLRKKINWLQNIIFIILTLILIGGVEIYLYLFVYSKLNSTNYISLKNKIITSVKEYLSKP